MPAPLRAVAVMTPEMRAVHHELRKGLFGLGKKARARRASAKAQKQRDDWNDWHEQYGFHSTDTAGHARAHSSLHLRMAHYHHAHGEHDAAAAHYAAHQAQQAVASGAKSANPFKAHGVSDAAWRHSSAAHAPGSTRSVTPAAAASTTDPHLHGFRHAPGSDSHRQAHGDVHFRMAQYHKARGEHGAAEAHWQVHQAIHSGGTPDASHVQRAWGATAEVHPPRTPRTGRGGGGGGRSSGGGGGGGGKPAGSSSFVAPEGPVPKDGRIY